MSSQTTYKQLELFDLRPWTTALLFQQSPGKAVSLVVQYTALGKQYVWYRDVPVFAGLAQ